MEWPKKGSWSRVSYHCQIRRQNRRKLCLDEQHTHSKKENQLLQLLAGFCWKFGEAIGTEWRGLESGKRGNRESRGALEFFFGVLWDFQYNVNFCTILYDWYFGIGFTRLKYEDHGTVLLLWGYHALGIFLR